ncbi:uncharacterized protein RCC_00289 [Ramularia collo-cygni]|uniref:Kelch repeat-containing protein n=1 Tax=Ramularia collo-cygni TaxID=112498 RepID=A0A2D3ULA8_9PEZI|nr:uncharacterized protein RCC_00289 [Ramularia collo-cygni]CZT14312.1 uncharacterized protein RCC_00289 [Ramularia collo-cygni]
MYRMGAIVFLLVAIVPLLHSTSFFGHASMPMRPVSGGFIPERPNGIVLDRRQSDSPTAVCKRWAQMSTVVNGTLYLYGGQATETESQKTDTWNNNFLSLDLTESWQISTPRLTGLPQPSGPPNISLGALWNSYDSLFVYGGQFSDSPPEEPSAFSLWEYDIAESVWNEHSDPVTSKGVSAPSDGDKVQRAAEGAAVSVPSLGKAFYFGGHLDGYTTEGWSQSIARVYLQSLLEYTFPGYANPQVDALHSSDAPAEGIYRNITEGGLQAEAGFTKRADGLLIYVPGFGDDGILVALAGGTNESYTQMNTVNVYDIAKSSWYTQATSGETPNIRVNPCAAAVAAPDGSSTNIYMFAGQNLIPYGNQTQYDDMWILTLPAFAWIKVDQTGQSVPQGRAGATCNAWDGQMIMVGGYTGPNTLSCETPGIYVYDMSNLQWVNQFTAISGTSSPDTTAALAADGSNSDASNNPLNQQPAQRFNETSVGGLQGSYGYQVPDPVISVVGGGRTGGATITGPINSATAGPLSTGKPITYTVTNSTNNGANSNNGNGGNSGPNIGAIVAGTIAGVLFIVACYLAFCAYVYRRQLQLYKRHVEMSQAQARGEKMPAIPGLLSTHASTGKKTPSDSSYMRGEGHNDSPWLTTTTTSEGRSSHHRSDSGGASAKATTGTGAPGGYASLRRNSEASDGADEDLLAGREPTFVGVMLNPRRSLRVINRD